MVKSGFIQSFKERGFFHQVTDEEGLKTIMDKDCVPTYIGFDCTASSLHVGSLIQIMILRMLQQYGHKPIVIVGGGTTKVGDPSGKDESRKLLTDEDIHNNMLGIKSVISKFVKFGDGPSDAIMVNNADWLDHLNYISFLRDYGKHFSVNRMLSFDSVKLRLEREQNLSFLEFNYMILQAYDFVELNKRYNCRLQIGGSDQWGNIVNGVELNRRVGGKDELFGLTTPLLTTSSGTKMGKTASGAVWLSEELLSPYDYYQFWRNTEDQDVIRFIKLFTELPAEEISKLSSLTGKELNEAKKVLAFEATKLCHGEAKALEAAETARKLFEEGSAGGALPIFEISNAELERGVPAYELFVRSGLVTSNGEARRLIRGKGARVNDVIIEDENQVITLSEVNSEGVIKLSSGKKNHMLVKVI
jgi:tyrosyl-tRNA synthetase